MVIYSPVWLLWVLVCGSQFEVGTDYTSYLEIFSYPEAFASFYIAKGEWLFSLILYTLHSLYFPPQLYFVFFYIVNFCFFIAILRLLDNRNSWIFVFLFIAFSTVFNNQLNGLRQYTAIYIITYAIILYYYKRSLWLFLLQIIIAGGIHLSSFLILPFVFILKWRFGYRTSLLMIGFATYFALFGSLNIFTNLISDYVPIYKAYLDSDANTANSLNIILTKIVFLPIYVYSILTVRKSNIGKLDQYLFRVGALGYSLRLAFLGNFIFNRVGQTFVLISILPVYVGLKVMYEKNKVTPFVFITAAITLFYLFKTVIAPKQEYLYNSIFFQ